MSPENAACLVAADVDCCVLGNNHVLDLGPVGLLDTLSSLERLRIESTGAGPDLDQTKAPASLDLPRGGRVIVFSVALVTRGVPRSWAAKSDAPGVNLLPDLSNVSAARIADQVARTRRPGDVVIVSVHWGPNWGYEVPAEQRRFAHELIDKAGVSIVHGHSSHHAKAIEVYHDRLILYGCGDFLNDYEGIEGYEEFLANIAVVYFASVAPMSCDLVGLDMVPLQIRRFQPARPSSQDTDRLLRTLDRETRRFGARVRLKDDGRFALSWG